MPRPSNLTTFLFTDIEGSTRLWEEEPERMRPALARHDAIARTTVEAHRGRVVKMTGDGVHAVFDDPLDAIAATIELQRRLADPDSTEGLPLPVRCGLHGGDFERRDDDFFGAVVNRAARIMSAAHGGQMLLSQAIAERIDGRLPEGVGLRDLGSVRLRDLASTERLYQVLHPELRAEFPALRSLAETPNNLPQPMTSFVGRERELAELTAMLARQRLVTLVGMGGLGKTRLSLHLAAGTKDLYADGAWFVELAPLVDARLVPQAVASVVGVKEEAGRPVIEALVKFVKDRKLLLVLDNCEHLIAACAELAKRLLQASPGLTILASSREPLRVTGEATYPLSTLSTPPLRAFGEPGALLQSDAVRLFVERVIAVQPAFEIDSENAAAVSAICHRLDGIPLALELAAPQMRLQSAQKLSERLIQRLRLPMRGDPTVMPRQQTLRMLIDWSYDLLSDAEQSLFRQLATFAGGWTLEAAEAVCACEGEEVADLLGRLVDKSLVLLGVGGERYHLLETVREYALERLAAAGESEASADRHLEYYAGLVERAKTELVGPDQAVWLARLDPELENILAAHRRADSAKGWADAGLRLAGSMKHYWFSRGLLELGLRVTIEALTRRGPELRDELRMRGLFYAGQIDVGMARFAAARELLEESLGIARELDDRRAIAAVLQPLGIALLGEGEVATARRYLEEAHILARERDDKRGLTASLAALAQLHRVEGDLAAAESLNESALVLARASGDSLSVAIGLLNLAMIAVERGEAERARTMLLEVLDIAEETGSRPATVNLIEVCAALAVVRASWSRALLFYGAAEALAAQTGLHRDPADEHFLAPLVARARASLDDAARDRADAAGRALPLADALQEARDWLSRA